MDTIRLFPGEDATSEGVKELIYRELRANGAGAYKIEIMGGPQDIPYDPKTTRVSARPDGHAIFDYNPKGFSATPSRWERIKQWLTKLWRTIK